jgi:hypothetical protein
MNNTDKYWILIVPTALAVVYVIRQTNYNKVFPRFKTLRSKISEIEVRLIFDGVKDVISRSYIVGLKRKEIFISVTLVVGH